MNIQQNEALFAIFGIVYGGDGRTTFALPDLRGRVPVHNSFDFPIGWSNGSETETLAATEIATHSHTLMATTAAATTPNPAGALLATAPATLGDVYAQSTNADAAMPAASSPAGTSSPHANMQPFLVVNYIVCLLGVFPEMP